MYVCMYVCMYVHICISWWGGPELKLGGGAESFRIAVSNRGASQNICISLSLSLYIYIYIDVCIHIEYICLFRIQFEGLHLSELPLGTQPHRPNASADSFVHVNYILYYINAFYNNCNATPYTRLLHYVIWHIRTYEFRVSILMSYLL